MVHGTATFLDDDEEKLFAMEIITNHVHPNRWNDSRTPPRKSELASTGVIRVNITSASAKIRTGPPNDKDKEDWADMEMRNRVWVGVIPLRETLGEPVPVEHNLVKTTPHAIREHIEQRNAKEKAWSELAARKRLDLPLEHENEG
jgi:uncharacterized protein